MLHHEKVRFNRSIYNSRPRCIIRTNCNIIIESLQKCHRTGNRPGSQNSRSVSNSGANSSSAAQHQNMETTATVNATAVNHTPVANATAGINAGITADSTQSATIIQEENKTIKKKLK